MQADARPSSSPLVPTIDGVVPATVETPATAQDVANVLVSAAAAGATVAPVGGGSMLALGNVPDRIDVALSTARLDRVLHYEPTDLTLSVEAGVRFADLQALLGERGQCLPVEVPDADRATVGGMVATALAGPRRLGSGTLRDLIIGISVAYPNGTVAKAGGLVVKNVTGFDLMRLHHGALGTLGVITSINFKVLPKARSEATLLYNVATRDEASERANRLRAHRSRPLALEIVRQLSGWQLALRYEGRPPTVALIVEGVVGIAGHPARMLMDDESADWWVRFVQEQSLHSLGNTVVVRAGTVPSRVARLAAQVDAILAQQDIAAEAFDDLGRHRHDHHRVSSRRPATGHTRSGAAAAPPKLPRR